MSRIISVANQKGGVGKTTTAVNLSACLAVSERKVLLIDLDPQANASSGVGIGRNDDTKTIYHVLSRECSIEDAIYHTEIEWLHVIPSNIDLIGSEIELLYRKDREMALKEIIADILDEYEFIVIDCPPSLSNLTINSLAASDSVLIPIQCEYYALEGLSQFLNTIRIVKIRLNPRLRIEGILMTMFDKRTNLSRQVVDDIRNYFPREIFKTIIPRNVRLSEAPSHGKPVIMYDIRSTGAKAYFCLAKEMLKNDKKRFGKRAGSLNL